RARTLAARLRRLGVGPERRVAVLADRGPELVTAQLGVLLAGGAYVPVDPDYPAERIAFQLADAAVAAVVVPPELAGRLPETSVPVLAPPTRAERGAAAAPERDAAGPAAPEHLAYVIYTSGSTGRPKGVEVTHGALANLVAWHRRRFGVDAAARASLLASPAFDASVWEVWPYLAAGAALAAVPDALRAAPPALARWLAAEGVTHTFLPVALGEEVLAEVPRGAALRVALTGGEAVRWRPPADAAFETVNCYGPTENAVVATSATLAPRGEGAPPIGGPLDGVEAYVLDRRGRLALPGVPGELVLGGASLARGYLGRPGRTAQSFVPHPFGAAGGRLYRTGDLVRWRAGGALEFLGRIDQQVKIRGFRIEPGEVEAALRELGEVREAVVAVLAGPAGPRLVGYVVPAEPSAAEGLAERARRALAARLPPYMVPAAVLPLPELPLTPNGKVDRAALPAPEEGAGSLAPRTPGEVRLAALWSELLGRETVGAGDDFFALGGHSLLATRLVLRLHEELGIELPVRQVFETPVLAELARAVDQARTAGGETLVPVPRDGELPLSFAQERLWFLDRLEPNQAVYNVPAVVPLPSAAGLEVLAAALTRVVARHEVLRTVYPEVEGRPVQVVRPVAPVALPVIDLSGLPTARREAEGRRVAAVEAGRPFDLAADPVLRAATLRLAPANGAAGRGPVLLLTIHHVASDGWSMELLRHEVEELVRAGIAGRAPRLPELPVQYADHAVWQRRRLSGDRLATELAWWRGQLAGLPPELDLLPDAPPREPGSRRGATVQAHGPARLAEGLQAVARSQGATLFMTLLAGFQALLGRWTGQRDLAVGVPVAGRDRPEVQALIGFFVNTLVARADLGGEPGFGELVARTRRTMLALQAHQEMPFERLVEELAPSRRLGRPPLVQAIFVLQAAAFERRRSEDPAAAGGAAERAVGHAADPAGAVAGGAKFDLTLGGSETPEGLAFTLEYERGLFASATARRFLDAYLRLLTAAVAEPERPVADLPLLSAAEHEQVLREWPGRVGEVAEASIPELFAVQAAARPEAPALAWPATAAAAGGAMTYGDLAAASHRLARHLAARGVGLESRVGVALPRGPELVVALLAVLEAGGSYVPLDPAYPAERLAYMLANGGIEVLLTRDGLLAEVAQGAPAQGAVQVIDLARDAAAVAARAPEPLGRAVPPEALAYVLYTSGSTGLPKGVAVPHRGVARLVRGADYSRLDAGTTFLQLAPVAFDLSTLEIWGPLANGGCLAVPPPGELSLAELERWIAELGVTHLWLTAGLFHLVVDERLQALAPLAELLAGGDVLSPAHVARVRRELPALRLTNGYGPTENTTFTSCHRVGEVPGAATVGGSVPIGRPIAGTTVYVVDPALRPLPPGVAGELVTGGAGLARGYLGRPALTAERFVPDPFAGDGGRLYRTGDRARWLPGGVLEFLGRLDTQVKVRGFRVEPGEVEAVLIARPEVREAVVVARDDGAGAARLVAYVVPEAADPGPGLAVALQGALRERLPDFMVPSAVVLLAELPLNPNSKVDRRALPEPELGGAAVAPRDELERALLALWEEVLGRPVPGVEDDFFALGGHSLLAVRLLHRVRQSFGTEVPLASLFTDGTVALQARRLRAGAGAAGAAAAPVVVPVRGGEGAPLICVHAIGGNVMAYHELARRLGRPFVGLQSPPEGPPESIEAMAERYLTELRAAGVAGPWHLGGWSMGALVAWEMARRLTREGEPVALLALLDPPHAARAEREAMNDAARVAAFARDLAGLGLAPAALPPAELAGLTPDEAFERLAAGSAGGKAPDPDVLRRLYRAFRGNLDAMAAYDAPPWEGRVELLLATEGGAALVDLLADDTRGWGERAAAAGVHHLPGNHYSWLRPPAVGAWAERLAALAGAADGTAALSDRPGAEEVPV
ncbi:MAG TPA: amino acid adenylation domain-containing protein, partial [Thermoanaerobaculia bacterium]|nr:amino acid adenylation domain-containing protein [Thermoanaerobaculia bacterium]